MSTWYVAAPPWEQDLLVAGGFERTAHVWSLERAAKVASIDTVFDHGGQRLALTTGPRPAVVAGAWTRHGVCGYSLDGDLIWQSTTRSHVQHITALTAGRVAVGYARGPCAVLDVTTGGLLASLSGVTQVETMTTDLTLLVSSTSVRIADGDLEPVSKRIALRSFAVLGAAASADHVAVAEAAGPLRILDLGGVERALFDVEDGHVRAVSRDPATGTWVALTHRERSHGIEYALVRLSDDADVLDRTSMPDLTDATWLGDGSVLAYCNDEGTFIRRAGHDEPHRLDP